MSDKEIPNAENMKTDFLTRVHLFESVDETTTDFHPKVVTHKSRGQNNGSNEKKENRNSNFLVKESRRENISNRKFPVKHGNKKASKTSFVKSGIKHEVKRSQPVHGNPNKARKHGVATPVTKHERTVQSDRSSTSSETTIECRSQTVVNTSSSDDTSTSNSSKRGQNKTPTEHSSPNKAVFSVISHLEQTLEEERKRNLHLETELTSLRNHQTQRENELRGSYDSELVRLQSIITKLQTTRTSLEQRIQSPSPPNQSNMTFSPRIQASIPQRPRTREYGEANELISRLQREIQHQDELIAGYQRENERLYNEVKQLSKETQPDRETIETAERLANENASLRVELERMHKENRQRAKHLEELLQDNRSRDHTNEIAELEHYLSKLKAELKIAARDRDTARAEVANTKQKVDQLICKQKQLTDALQLEIDQNRVEREKLKETHRESVLELQRKLQWYMENQALVNRDQAKLKAQVKEISQLKEQLTQTELQLQELKHGTCTTKKQQIQHSVGISVETTQTLLEHRVKSLEAELEQSRENEKRAIRSLQQQYEAVKFQYEERIRTLEDEIKSNYSVTRQSTEVQTVFTDPETRGLSVTSTDGIKPCQLPINLDKCGSQTVQNLLNKLRSQIGNLKHELVDRQRAIDELKRISALNTSVGDEPWGVTSKGYPNAYLHRPGSVRRTPKTTAFIRSQPTQINKLLHQSPSNRKRPLRRPLTRATSADDLEKDINEVAAARLTMQERIAELERQILEQQKQQQALHPKGDEPNKIKTREAGTLTDNAWIMVNNKNKYNAEVKRLEAELDKQTCLIVQLQAELTRLRAMPLAYTESTNENNLSMDPTVVHNYCVQAYRDLTAQLNNERRRSVTLERQLSTLQTLHQVTVVGLPVQQGLTKLFEQLCAVERESKTCCCKNSVQVPIDNCPCQHVLLACMNEAEHWRTLANTRTAT